MALDVIAITGMGGMGRACARRLGAGHQLLLADIDADLLESTAATLRVEGFAVQTQHLDVADVDSVAAFARRASELGFIRTLVHTAGISQSMADARRVYAVDLVGTANMLDAFFARVGAGSVAVIIASMAGQSYAHAADIQVKLATLPTNELLEAALAYNADDSQLAYSLAKRGNQLRVEEVAVAWGRRGARVVSVSPGPISTPMLEVERRKPQVAALLDMVPIQRIGTAEDIAAAVQWLSDPAANFITGADIRVDGGLVAAMRQAGLVTR